MYSQFAELAYERQREQREDAANHRLCNELASDGTLMARADTMATRGATGSRPRRSWSGMPPPSHGDSFVPGLAARARRMSRGLRAGLRSSFTTWV